MKHYNAILAGLILSTALLAINGPAADDKPAPPQSTIVGASMDAWLRRVAELGWPDQVPLSEVADVLRKKFPEINFIVPEAAQDTLVPGLTLRSVTLDDVIKAIELASEGRIRASYSKSREDNLVGFMVARAPSQRSPVICRVFSLAAYLDGRKEEDARRAIKDLHEVLEVAWQMSRKYERDVEAPSLQIHAGTKLLIAVGHEKELAVIEQVIRQLQGSAPSTTVPAQNLPAHKPEAAPGKPRPLF